MLLLGGNSTLQGETPLEAFLGGQHLFTQSPLPPASHEAEKHVANAAQSQKQWVCLSQFISHARSS